MKNISIIGSSDLALHMASYLKNEDYKIIGLFDDYVTPGKFIEDYMVLGGIKDIVLFKDKIDSVFIGIGYKYLKEKAKISEYLSEQNIKLETFFHRTAYIDKTAIVDSGIFILPNCTLDKNVNIGRNVFLNPNCSVSHDSIVGSETFFGPGAVISGKSKIGCRCFIGAGSVIKDNIIICDDVLLGAGSVVVNNITEAGIYYGVPARKK